MTRILLSSTNLMRNNNQLSFHSANAYFGSLELKNVTSNFVILLKISEFRSRAAVNLPGSLVVAFRPVHRFPRYRFNFSFKSVFSVLRITYPLSHFLIVFTVAIIWKWYTNEKCTMRMIKKHKGCCIISKLRNWINPIKLIQNVWKSLHDIFS